MRISWSIGSKKSFGHVLPVGVEPSTSCVNGEHPIHCDTRYKPVRYDTYKIQKRYLSRSRTDKLVSKHFKTTSAKTFSGKSSCIIFYTRTCNIFDSFRMLILPFRLYKLWQKSWMKGAKLTDFFILMDVQYVQSPVYFIRDIIFPVTLTLTK